MQYWLEDIESFEAICQDDEARRMVLRLAQLSRAGTVAPLLTEFARAGAPEELRRTVAELASDESFLFAVEDYVHRTQRFH